MGLIYKPNGEKAIPDREMFSAKMWEKHIEKLMKPSAFEEIMMINELRRSCGVKPDGKDTVKINFRKEIYHGRRS